ncbi:MAG TPA: leucine-rich repeat protein, partial [Terrimesophilobacter sp.]|nr:leucine-rich repeat protein [Terrimesophilobacter sp.]
TSVTLGHGLPNIPAGTFFANQLTTIDIPANITAIGNEAFFNNAFATLTIPDSVTSIGDSAFSVMSTLASLTLGKGLTSIGAYAFAATGLTTVSIPASVTDIGERAFDTNDSGMVSAVFQGAAPSAFSPRGAGVGSLGDVDATIYYSSAHAADFTPSPWNGYNTAPGATLTFAMGGHGTPIAPAVVVPGGTVPQPADPAATGYTFDGWFTTATGDEPFDFTTPLTGDAATYARWSTSDLAATGAESALLAIGGGALLLVGLLALFSAAYRTRRTGRATR